CRPATAHPSIRLRGILNLSTRTVLYSLSLHDALPILAKLSLLASVIVIASMVVAGSFMSAELRDGLMIGMGSVLLLFGIRQAYRSEEHTSELHSRENLVCRLPLEKIKVHDISYPQKRC